MINTVITTELETRQRDKANFLKVKMEAIDAMGSLTKYLADRREEIESQHDNIVKELLDYDERKRRTEASFERGLITYEEALHIIEHDAVKTFFE